MTVLYILLGVLLFLFLLTLCPVRFDLEFREEFRLEARYLFLRFPLLPGEPEEAEEEPEPEKPQEEPKEDEAAKPGAVDRIKAALKREGLSGFLQALGELIQLAAQTSARMLRRLKLRRFDLYLCIGGAEDAAAAAVLYGQVAAGLYSACGGLFSLVPCKRKGVTVDLDYGAPTAVIDFSTSLSIRPIFVLKGLAVLLLRGWKPLRRIL